MFKIKDHPNLEFFASHFIVVLATVLGVYLAALKGFELAMDLEVASADRNTYYEMRAMQDELQDNLQQTDRWGQDFVGGHAGRFRNKQEEHQLDLFVWHTMQEASTTFQIPPPILSGVRRYYSAARIGLLRMTDSTPDRAAVDRMLQAGQTVRSDLLPAIETELKRLQGRLTDAGIDL